MGIIRTILGDIESQNAGFTYSHEHIVIDECFVTNRFPEFLLNDLDKIIPEIQDLRTLGVQTMVDTMPANSGRNVVKLAEVSSQTGMQILCPTGIHLDKYYPGDHWQYKYTVDQITDLLVKDVEVGIDMYDYSGPIIDRTPHKAGLVKFASGDETFSQHQEKIFETVVNCHIESGCPILTHTNNGLQALEQAEFMLKRGAKEEHIVLSHVDRNHDHNYVEEVLKTGVSLEFDSAFRWKDKPNNTLAILKKFLPLYPTQFTLGMDAARYSYWKTYGGTPGLDYLITTFIPILIENDLGGFVNTMFYTNPQRIFSFWK
ncbi:MAG: phosphotriesterase family protein [Leadbetterella sp.]